MNLLLHTLKRAETLKAEIPAIDEAQPYPPILLDAESVASPTPAPTFEPIDQPLPALSLSDLIPVTPFQATAVSPPTVMPKSTSAPPPTNPVAAKRNFVAPIPAQASPSLLPWLISGSALILGGIGAYFWWSYQQVQRPSAPAVPSTMVAISVPAHQASPVALDTTLQVDHNTAPLLPEAPAASPTKPDRSATPSIRDTATTPLQPTTTVRVEHRSKNMLAPINDAYQTYQAGKLEEADTLYRRVLAQEPHQRDALLGMAAIQARQNHTVQAQAIYRQILLRHPDDAAAQAGLASLAAQASETFSESDESWLKSRAEAGQTEAAFTLGTHYAAQNRWAEAQSYFFRAWIIDSNQPDIAFNLAISLDQLNQPALAVDFYQRALDLSQRHSTSFDTAAVHKRLTELKAL